jgi:hypothetical protein
MMRRMLAVLLVGGFLLAAGPTGAQEPKSKMPETPWYPLAVGTKWIYKYDDGKKCQFHVTGHEDFGGAVCAKVELSIDGKVVSFEHVSVTKDGVFRNGFAGTKADKPVQILKLPPKKGDTWEVESKALGTESVKGKFTTDEEEIKVGDKSYKTFKVTGKDMDANGLKFSTTYYFAVDVGLVKQVIEVGEATKQTTTLELEKFEGPKKEEK